MNWSTIGLLLMLAFQGEYRARINASREMFFRQDFRAAAEQALAARELLPGDPESYEARTSALLFLLKREMGTNGSEVSPKKFSDCHTCPPILELFYKEQKEGEALAQNRLRRSPGDVRFKFVLAKLKLNLIWLNLQVLKKREGLGEFKQARSLLNEVRAASPNEPRALTALAWINYAVAEKVPWALRWIVGGGSKEDAFRFLNRAVACTNCTELERAEAQFALAEMLKSEGRIGESEIVLRDLRRRFPSVNGNGGKEKK
ncbi:MAG TPA: hypothetical protein VJL32_03000 [Candidatus Paceibacterota bacterium]